VTQKEKKEQLNPMSDAGRARFVRIIYGALVGYVLLICVCGLGYERFNDNFCSIIVVRGLEWLRTVIPTAAVVLWFLNRPVREEHSKGQRIALVVARIFLFLAWIYLGFCAVLWRGAIRSTYLDLRESGPDTVYAQRNFTNDLHEASLQDVTNLCFYKYGFVGTPYSWFRFQSSDPAVVSRLVAQFKMREGTKEDGRKVFEAQPDAMPWWDRNMNQENCVFYEKLPGPNGPFDYWYLWFNPETRTVWFHAGGS
jgi:hypothetical protein